MSLTIMSSIISHKNWILSILCILYCCINVDCQEVKVTIQINTDNSPQHTKWYLLGENKEYIAFQNEDYTEANTLYEHSVFVEKDLCVTFYITDDFGNGLTDNGSYMLFADDVLIASGQEFEFETSETFNCEEGESCESAIVIDTIPFIYSGLSKTNNWFVFIPENTFEYKLTTCNSGSVNHGQIPDTQILVYDECKLNTGGLQGSVTIRDDDPNCTPGTTIEALQLSLGQPYYINIGIADAEIHDGFTFEFSYNFILGCMDENSCNFNPFATIDDGSCYFDNCSPDLMVNQDSLFSSISLDTIINNDECLIREGCLSGSGQREIIRFTTAIENIGDTDYLLGNSSENETSFSYNNCHQHLHALGYAEYLLYAGAGDPLPVGFKNGFCISDLECDNFNNKYTCEYMGISAGCADIYGADLDCQWIDITDIPDGNYTLVVRINWNRLPDVRQFSESNFENNWAQVCIDIDRSNGATVIQKIEDCVLYKDCLGVTFGQTDIDCMGVCGGSAHYGDLNGDLKVDGLDVNQMFDDIHDNNIIANHCEDIYNDGKKSIYDMALLQRCLDWQEQDPSTNHNHCLFPTGYINSKDIIEFDLVNVTEKYFDIYYHSPQNDLKAVSISIDGVVLEKVEYMFAENIPMNNLRLNESSLHYYSFREDFNISENREMEWYARVYFKALLADQICISNIDDIVNINFERAISVIKTQCVDLSSVNTNEHDFENRFIIYPTIVDSDFIIIESEESLDIEYQITDIKGQTISVKKEKSTPLLEIDVNQLPQGLYFLKLKIGEKSISKRFIKV